MRHKIVKRPQAERDTEECAVYIAEENLDAAISFLTELENTLEQLSNFPYIGNKREYNSSQLSGMRMWRVGGFENYLIFYLVTDNHVEIIRILHSSRDIQELFKEDE